MLYPFAVHSEKYLDPNFFKELPPVQTVLAAPWVPGPTAHICHLSLLRWLAWKGSHIPVYVQEEKTVLCLRHYHGALEI